MYNCTIVQIDTKKYINKKIMFQSYDVLIK